MKEAKDALNLSINDDRKDDSNTNNNDKSNNSKLNTLISMGFDQNIAIIALALSNQNINLALQYMLQINQKSTKQNAVNLYQVKTLLWFCYMIHTQKYLTFLCFSFNFS